MLDELMQYANVGYLIISYASCGVPRFVEQSLVLPCTRRYLRARRARVPFEQHPFAICHSRRFSPVCRHSRGKHSMARCPATHDAPERAKKRA